MFLKKTELKELTGYARPSSHIKWLNENGYPFEVGADGYPRVLNSFVEKRLGASIQKKSFAQKPKFSALMAG